MQNSWWWRHQMETFSALLALCEGYPPVIGGFPSQRPVTWSCVVFFDLRLNKQLSIMSKQSRRRWFETPSRSLWCHYNEGIKSNHIPRCKYDILNISFIISICLLTAHKTLKHRTRDQVVVGQSKICKCFINNLWHAFEMRKSLPCK